MGRPRYKNVKKTAFVSALAFSLNQTGGIIPTVSAEELQYDGTTEMSTVDESLDIEGLAAELVVEEVYVEAGEQIQEGTQILKLTEESYQEALDYYEAAIIRAENTLTNTQLEYDEGILEAKYEYEMAEAQAEQAEFVCTLRKTSEIFMSFWCLFLLLKNRKGEDIGKKKQGRNQPHGSTASGIPAEDGRRLPD